MITPMSLLWVEVMPRAAAYSMAITRAFFSCSFVMGGTSVLAAKLGVSAMMPLGVPSSKQSMRPPSQVL